MSGLAGMLAAYALGVIVTQARGVSNFEGARAYLVVFALSPAGLLTGVVVGLVLLWPAQATGIMAWLTRTGIATGITLALVGGVAGYFWITTDRAPDRDGRPLMADFEIWLPPGSPPADQFQGQQFAGRLYSSDNSSEMKMAFDSATERDGGLVIPGTAYVFSSAPNLRFGFGLPGSPFPKFQMFDAGQLSRRDPGDTTWSEWREPSSSFDGSPLPPTRYRIRFRVRLGDPPT